MHLLTGTPGRFLEGLGNNQRKLIVFLGTFAVCLLSARFGAVFYLAGHSAPALIWFPSGIALALIFVEGYYLAWAVALGVFAAALMGDTVNLSAAAVSALANALQGATGAYLLEKFRFQSRLGLLRDSSVLIAVAILVSTIVPTAGILESWWLHGSAISFTVIDWSSWGPWWLGEFLSALLVGPLLIRWLAKPIFHRTGAEWVEFFAAFAVLLSIEFVLFWTPETSVSGLPLNYLILIPFIWMAFRIGPRGLTFALFIAPVFAVCGIFFGFNMPPASDRGHEIFLLQVFFAIMSILFLIFVALVEERKNATRELTGHVDELEKALHKISREDEAKSEFLAILAHELRNPLAPVLSSLELMRLGGVPASEHSHHVSLMENRVRTMGRLLDDLLDISRISQKKFTLRKERVTLQPIVESAVLTVKGLMEARNHALTLKVPSRPIELTADPVRVEQIIVNLLTNAAKYTPQGGKIHLEAKQDGTTLSLLVRDNGIGIEEEMLKSIFEPFLQVSQGKTSNTGLGIGLFLTKNLVTMHDGYIDVRSRGKGAGTEFFVFLPLGAAAVAPKRVRREAHEVAAPAPRLDTESEHAVSILLVDDNEAAAQSLGKLLSLKGYDVAIAYTGAEALRKAARLKPDGIILDIGLPDMEGYEVARRIRETAAGKEAFLVALTGYGQESDKAKAEAAGFNHHLTKPVGLKELEPVLAQIPR